MLTNGSLDTAETWQAEKADEPSALRAPASSWLVGLLRGLLCASLAAYGVVFLWIIANRLIDPYELDWLSGPMLEAVERVRAGHAIYVAPSSGFTPFLYPPIYYWVSAAASAVFGTGFFALRAVSLAATAGTAWLVCRAVRRATGSRFWTLTALGLFFAVYCFTGAAYDLERPDSLMMFLALAASTVLAERDSTLGTLAAAALVTLAVFTKQPALCFVVGGAAGAWLGGRRRQAWLFGGTALGLIASVGVIGHLHTHGWLTYYALWLPLAHNLDNDLIPLFFGMDMPRLAIWILLSALLFALLWGARRSEAGTASHGAGFVLGMQIWAGFAASMFNRLHFGGWSNVLMFLTTMLCYGAAVCAWRIEGLLTQAVPRHVTGCRALLYGGLFAQCALLYSNPAEVSPNPSHLAAGKAFAHLVARLETEGDVLVASHGATTRSSHVHSVALWDVLRVEKKIPAELEQDLSARRFAAIVLDEPYYDKDLQVLVDRNYYVSEKIMLDRPWVATGLPMKPMWVLRPRRESLPKSTSKVALERRREGEMMLAQLLAHLTDTGQPSVPPDRLERIRQSLYSGVVDRVSLRDELCKTFPSQELCQTLAAIEQAGRTTHMQNEQLTTVSDLLRAAIASYEDMRQQRDRAQSERDDVVRAQGTGSATPAEAAPTP